MADNGSSSNSDWHEIRLKFFTGAAGALGAAAVAGVISLVKKAGSGGGE